MLDIRPYQYLGAVTGFIGTFKNKSGLCTSSGWKGFIIQQIEIKSFKGKKKKRKKDCNCS